MILLRKTALVGALVASGMALSAPAAATVAYEVLPAPRLSFSPKQQAMRAKAARVAVMEIEDFSSMFVRPSYLDDAHRAVSASGISSIREVRKVVLLGERAFVLATGTRYLGSVAYYAGDVYFECLFDETHNVVKIELLQ